MRRRSMRLDGCSTNGSRGWVCPLSVGAEDARNSIASRENCPKRIGWMQCVWAQAHQSPSSSRTSFHCRLERLGTDQGRCAAWTSTVFRVPAPNSTSGCRGSRRATSCDPSSQVGPSREPMSAKSPCVPVVPSTSPLRTASSPTFIIASVSLSHAVMAIPISKERRRRFLFPPEGRRAPTPHFFMANGMANGRWQEVELQQIDTYTVTGLLSTGPASSLYIGKQLKKLKQRYIIDIQDYGFTQHTQDTQDTGKDYAYLVMQYVPAGTVRQNISPGQCLRSDEVKRMLSPLASALHYAHVSNILHGNLHPCNLLVDTNNDILLTDFSLPLQSAFPSPDDATLAIPYMAPEQLQGTLMAASDQYSLAVMVYEWLCGRRPYEATGREKLLHQQEREPLPAPGSLNADISPAIERVLLQALSHDPGERFQHTQAFADNYLRALMGLPLNIETTYIGSTIPTPSTSIGDNTKATKGSVEAAHIAHSVQFIAPSSSPIVPSVDTPAANMGSDIDPVHNATTEDSTSYDPKAENDVESRRNPPAKFATPIGSSQLHDIVVADLCQGGILSQSLPGYEERPAQIEMATLVAQSLSQSTPALLEASTGTGKSLAYLVPIVRSSKVAIISTANKALQEQLFYKDIPFVQQHIKHFEAALVKGVGNYLCLDRLENERNGLQFYAKNREFTRLVDITNDPDSTFSGDFETLDFQLPGDIHSKA